MRHENYPVKRQWLTAFLMAFIGLPLVGVMLVSAYGFIIWFCQLFFWGPPT